jgi:hypothetical protein
VKITREKIEKNLDTVVAVLNFLHELIGGKVLFSAQVVAQMTREAMLALEDGTLDGFSPEIVRAQLQALYDKLAANDAAADAALDAKFPAG